MSIIVVSVSEPFYGSREGHFLSNFRIQDFHFPSPGIPVVCACTCNCVTIIQYTTCTKNHRATPFPGSFCPCGFDSWPVHAG